MRPERLSDPKHPTQKPVSILKKMITIASNENDIIFDPFMGVGSTGVAALNLDRRFIGIELEGEYFKAAKKRIDSALEDNNSNENKLHVCGYKQDESKISVVCDTPYPYNDVQTQIDSFFYTHDVHN